MYCFLYSFFFFLFSSVDLVTETDQNVEKVIFKAISEKYPNHKLIGEEVNEKHMLFCVEINLDVLSLYCLE